MNFKSIYFLLVLVSVICGCNSSSTQQQDEELQTRLILSNNSAKEISVEIQNNPLLKTSFELALEKANSALENGVEIPLPKDPGGGYSHEKHKKNYSDMYHSALAFQVSGESKYLEFVEQMLLGYSAIYSTLPLHPQRKENHPAGKLFWQGLNESVWLFYTIQAYDMVKHNISEVNRAVIENQLLLPVAKFLSEDSYETFNKIHNHGTWSVAAVGMTGFVLDNQDLVDIALLGSEKNGETGFLKQLEDLFSPDGYYSEGPYYQRYAMLPFIVFAEAIEENKPELKIFEYRDELLKKAVTTIVQLTNSNGFFYPFNDAIKDKDFHSDELVFAVNIAFERYQDSTLLPVILEHGKVSLTNAGLAASKAVKDSPKTPYARKSQLIRDGANGDQGGVALMRMKNAKNGQLDAVFKFASQGMGHGHFDRLSLLLYNDGEEILQDYGAARFLNVEAKQGGRYLPENKSFAKQSIAHNTLIVDETSHYQAKVSEGEKHAPQLLFADIKNDTLQIVSAQETNAYDDVALTRTLAMIDLGDKQPFILDVLTANSGNPHQYDLNFQYMGQLMDTNFEYAKASTLEPLGTSYGYQHLYKLATGNPSSDFARLTFLQKDKFYSISTTTNKGTELILTQIGANDPEFNLRNEAGYLVRNQSNSLTTVSIIEPHGSFNPRLETVQSPNSNLEYVKLEFEDASYVATSFKFKNSEPYILIFPKQKTDTNTQHTCTFNKQDYVWKGAYLLITKSN